MLFVGLLSARAAVALHVPIYMQMLALLKQLKQQASSFQSVVPQAAEPAALQQAAEHQAGLDQSRVSLV